MYGRIPALVKMSVQNKSIAHFGNVLIQCPWLLAPEGHASPIEISRAVQSMSGSSNMDGIQFVSLMREPIARAIFAVYQSMMASPEASIEDQRSITATRASLSPAVKYGILKRNAAAGKLYACKSRAVL